MDVAKKVADPAQTIYAADLVCRTLSLLRGCRHFIGYTTARIGFLKLLHAKINHPLLTKPKMLELCDCPHHRVGVLQNHYNY